MAARESRRRFSYLAYEIILGSTCVELALCNYRQSADIGFSKKDWEVIPIRERWLGI